MMELLLVAVGGAFGSLSRYLLGRKISERAMSNFPYGTFIINISGAILLGIVSSIKLNGSIYLLLADGFLGAFTTFSTFMYEGFNLFQENEKLNALVYILCSFLIGVIGFFVGIEIAKFCNIFIQSILGGL